MFLSVQSINMTTSAFIIHYLKKLFELKKKKMFLMFLIDGNEQKNDVNKEYVYI